jgi:RND family efflux transporter MFP subunit
MKQVHASMAIAFLALLASCSSAPEEQKSSNTDTVPVKVINIESAQNGAVVAVSGQFTTDDEAVLAFKTGGIINKIYVKEGDAVKEGQLLATLNMTEINAQVDIARAAYEKANRDYQRVLNLYRDSVATLEQSQNARTGVDIAKQQLSAAEFNRTYSQIRASKSGFVLRKLAAEGQVVAPGTPVFQVNGAQSGTWTLKAGVSDREWAAIKTGDKALISVSALNNESYDAVVCRRSEGADPLTGSFNVELKFTVKHPELAAGMFGKAVITTSGSTEAAKTWTIPYDALLDGDGNTGYVFVTNDRKTAHKVKVTIASLQKDQILISDGLQDAQTLIISGSAYLGDSSKINIIQ